MMNDQQLIKTPTWKQAVEDFLALKAEPGHILQKQWIVDALRLQQPTTIPEKEKFDLDYLQGINSFRAELLEKHCIAFETVRGEGIKMLTAQEQVEWAIEQRDKLIGKSLRDGARGLLYLRSNELSADERASYMDLFARHANLASVIKRTRSLPSAFRELLDHKNDK